MPPPDRDVPRFQCDVKRKTLIQIYTVVVAQLVRALDCGSRGRRFEPGLPPHTNLREKPGGFFIIKNSEIRFHPFLYDLP